MPPLLDLVIRHCLAKDPDERWQRVRDLLVPLRWLASQEPLAPPATPATRLRWRWAAGGLIAAGLAVAAAIWTVRGVSSPTTLPRVEVAPPAGYSFAGDLVPSLALSPDSRHIVFRARNESGTQLYVKHAGEFAPAPIAGTNGAHTPFFSPDSQWIGFLVNGRIFKVPVSGGTPQRVTDAPSLSPTSLGATWGVEGSIVFAAGAAGLMRVSDAGGVADELTTPNESRGEMAHVWPQFLPGGREVLFTVRTSGDEWRLAVLSLASGDWDYLPPAGEMVAPRYLPEARQLVYAQSGGLFAVPLDISRRRFTGSPVPLPEPIYTHAFTGITVAQFAVSDRGMLVFMSGDPPDWTLVSANRNREVRVLVERPRGYRYPRISPNGQHLAVIIEERRADVHVLDMRDIRGVARSLTRVGTNTTPVWMPDSRSLVFSSRRPGSKSYDVYSVPIDGGEATSLFERPGAQFPTGWARGGVLAFDELTNRTARDIWRWSAAQGAINVLGNDSNERAATFSLDSQWLAYVSNETGEDEVYVTEYPGPGRTERLSVTGGTEPVWSPVNPRELFYRKGNQLLSVTFRTDPVFRADPPSELLAGPYVLAPAELGRPNYDVSRDGQWFVLVRSQERSTTRLRVMHEWLRGE